MNERQAHRAYSSLNRFLEGRLPPQTDAITAAFSEPPNRFQMSNLPREIKDPAQAEKWLMFMADSMNHVPAYRDAYVQAQNELRSQYRDWFQEHGHGGF